MLARISYPFDTKIKYPWYPVKAQDLNGHKLCTCAWPTMLHFLSITPLWLKSLGTKGLTEKVRTPPSNLCTDLMIIPGGMTSKSQILDVVSKSIGDQLRCLGGERLLSGNCPPARNKKTNLKHCLGNGLSCLEWHFSSIWVENDVKRRTLYCSDEGAGSEQLTWWCVCNCLLQYCSSVLTVIII